MDTRSSLTETLSFDSDENVSRVHIPGVNNSFDDTTEFYRHFGMPSYHKQQSYTEFDVPEAEETLKLMRKSFKILNPGNHVSRRTPEHASISFMHCRHIKGLGKQYVKLRDIVEERARVEFLRDCLFRIKSVTSFVQDLEHLVHAEYRTYYAIMHNCLTDAPVSKIYCLNALCEDLRTHVGHWNNIKQCLHTNKWLQPILGRLYLDLEFVRKTLSQLYSRAIFWMEKLILIGLQVFAHGNMSTLTQEVIWSISRGLEDFNNVANSLSKSRYMSTVYITPDYIQSTMTDMTCKSDPVTTNNPGHIVSSVKAMPFSKILNVIATERSKYAAIGIHQFFTSNDEFLRILFSGRLPAYVWNDEVQHHSHTGHPLDTSDYHTATGSMTSISGAVLKVGPIRAPDLTNYLSPLSDFAVQEQEFAETFLLVVNNSTNLLRKSESHSKSKHKSGKSPKSPSAKPPKGQDTPVLSRTDSKRKTVSWGDSADTSIRTQLVSRYMDVLWKCFGGSLEQCFHEPAWGCRGNRIICDLGSVSLCNATIIAVIRNMMEHACLKDMFPHSCVSPMLGVARKLHLQSALASWDLELCTALGCQTSDKCYPCPLASGNYSTKTGMLLRDTYQPLFSILQEHLKDLSESGKDASILLPKQDLDFPHVTSVVCRLLTSCQVSHSWCVHKSHSFLASWSVGNFLLVTQTDLKMLADQTKKALINAQTFNSKNVSRPRPVDQQMMVYLNEITKHMADVCDQMQTLSGASMKIFSEGCFKTAGEYFKAEMPVGKIWKKKSAQELPSQQNVYIEHALETILEPVVEGVSKLKQTAQLSAISMATTAFCEALKNHILKAKIKFSYIGACQLDVDVKYMSTWLGEYIMNTEVKQSILDLSIFKYMNGAVLLLKKQPYRKGSKFREPCSMEDLSCNGHSDMEAAASRNDHMSQSSDGEQINNSDESDIQYVNNIDEWLSLRVQGGNRGWRLPSCLNAPDTVE